jgi:Uma2 family endonuclease
LFEVVSPTDNAYNVETKTTLYLENGFGEFWVIFPHTGVVHVRRPGKTNTLLDINATLTGSGPLAGFSCRVRDLLRR